MRRVAAILLVPLLALACSGGDDDADVPPASTTTTPAAALAGGRLVVGLETEPASLDPAADVFGVSGLSAALAVFDPLLTRDADGEIVPYLAASLSADDAGTRWVIGLREGVTFTDGSPLDAAAVVAWFDRLLDAPILRTALRDLESVAALDAMTVELHTRPAPEFAELLTGQLGLVAGRAMTDARQPIGTGAFVVREWLPGERLVLERNPSYWRRGADLPHLDELELRPIPDPAERQAALRRGDVDVIHVAVDGGEGARRLQLVLNPAAALFEDPDCRSAVAAAAADQVDPSTDCVAEPSFELRTDQPDGVTDPIVAALASAGIDVRVERRDAGRLVLDELLGQFEALLRVDDGLLDVERRLTGDGEVDDTTFTLATSGWEVRAGDGVGGTAGRVPLPGGVDGETRPHGGVIVPAALHRVATEPTE